MSLSGGRCWITVVCSIVVLLSLFLLVESLVLWTSMCFGTEAMEYHGLVYQILNYFSISKNKENQNYSGNLIHKCILC